MALSVLRYPIASGPVVEADCATMPLLHHDKMTGIAASPVKADLQDNFQADRDTPSVRPKVLKAEATVWSTLACLEILLSRTRRSTANHRHKLHIIALVPAMLSLFFAARRGTLYCAIFIFQMTSAWNAVVCIGEILIHQHEC